MHSLLAISLFAGAVAMASTPTSAVGVRGQAKRVGAPYDPSDIARAYLSRALGELVRVPSHFFPGRTWDKTVGQFPSYIHINFAGDPALAALRSDFRIYDENMFCTAWVAELLLSAQRYGAFSLAEEDVQLVTDSILSFRDRNLAGGTEPVYSFWSQREVNGTWVAHPTNLDDMVAIEGGLAAAVHEFLKVTGQEKLWEKIEQQLEILQDTVTAFRIPPDFDDSAASMAIGAILHDQAEAYPAASAKWAAANADLGALAERISKYAYRPRHPNATADQSSIDVRSYYVLSSFFETEAGRDPDLALIPTWIQDISEAREMFSRGVVMPFNVNNIDASVVANAIYGIVRVALQDPTLSPGWITADLETVVRGSARYLAWVITSGTLDRLQDLALLYYPPKLDLYMMAARIVHALRGRYDARGVLPFLEDTFAVLSGALEAEGTRALLRDAKCDLGTAEQRMCAWNGFLGQGDTLFGRPDPHYDDRMFSTGVGMLALLHTWTEALPAAAAANDNDIDGESGSSRAKSSANVTAVWIKGTPQGVVETVTAAAAWLAYEGLTGNHMPENAFFSGSVKIDRDLPFQYPANVNEYLNGTKLDPHKALGDDTLLSAMRGVVTAAEYESMLAESWHGMPPVNRNASSNMNEGSYPFWSSPPLTYAAAAHAMSMFASLSK